MLIVDLPLVAKDGKRHFRVGVDMDEGERWRRAQVGADDFSAFRRRNPVSIGFAAALTAAISLAIFLGVAGLGVIQFWIAALVSICSAFLGGFCLTQVRNAIARKAYVTEYRRLNRTGQKGSAPETASKSSASMP